MRTPGPASHLRQRLARAQTLDEALALAAIEQICPHCPEATDLAIYRRVRELVAAKAWLDLTVLLIAWRVPQWRIREMHFDQGKWHCILALRWTPAPHLGRPVIAQGHALELALLSGLAEVLDQAMDLERPFANVVPLRPRDNPSAAIRDQDIW
jgi:hypothetical protein